MSYPIMFLHFTAVMVWVWATDYYLDPKFESYI